MQCVFYVFQLLFRLLIRVRIVPQAEIGQKEMKRERDAFVFTCVSINNKIAIDTIVCARVCVWLLIFYNYVHYADIVQLCMASALYKNISIIN